jgi:hypothetical protein
MSRTTVLVWDEFIKTIHLYVIPGDLRNKDGLVVCDINPQEARNKLLQAMGAFVVDDVYKITVDGEPVSLIGGGPIGIDDIDDEAFFSWFAEPEVFKATDRMNMHVITASMLKIDAVIAPWLVNKAQEDLRQCFAKFLKRLFFLDLHLKGRAQPSESTSLVGNRHANSDQPTEAPEAHFRATGEALRGLQDGDPTST